jgi:hypothetical protein
MQCGWLDAASKIGDFVGGFATLGGVVVALIFGTREIRRWRDEVRRWREQRQAEARSDPAARALLAIREVCLHVHHWCVVLQLATVRSEGADPATNVRSAVDFGLPLVEPLRRELQRAKVPAFVYLDERERELLREAEGLLVQVQLDAEHWAKNAGSTDRTAVRTVFASLTRAAHDLQARADGVLRSIARYEASTLSGPEHGAVSAAGTSR